MQDRTGMGWWSRKSTLEARALSSLPRALVVLKGWSPPSPSLSSRRGGRHPRTEPGCVDLCLLRSLQGSAEKTSQNTGTPSPQFAKWSCSVDRRESALRVLCSFLICCFGSSPRLLFLPSVPWDEGPNMGGVGEGWRHRGAGKDRNLLASAPFLRWFAWGRC